MKKLTKYIKKLFAIYIVRHFHFLHSYEDVGSRFIIAYFPDFMDEDGLQTFVVCQNAKCSKCGKETRYTYQIKGDHNLTRNFVEENYCA